MGFGDMVCLSRCPPSSPAPGQNCYTLPDASDPCCNITVCDKPVPDPDQNVQKEGANSESKRPRVVDDFDLASSGENFLKYLVLDVTANCIREIHCLALDGFDLNTVHKLSSKEKKILAEPGFKPGAARWEARMLPLCQAAT